MFVTGRPAMVIGKTLVIADLHIGITRELYEAGVSIPSQAKKLADKINELKRITKTKELVIAGDVKHKVPGTNYQELREVPELLTALKFKKIIITKGNHDGDIEKMINGKLRKKVKVRKAFAVRDYLITHGHMVVKKDKNIIIGHNHPHVRFRDRMGAIYSVPVWVRGTIAGKVSKKELVMVPAFNELCGSTAVNHDKLLGPVAKRIKNAHAYLLDGTDLGNIKDLKIE